MNPLPEEKNLSGRGTLLRKPRILVAPLDWGLGHATRCIPLIRELIQQGCEIWIAGEGGQEMLLKNEFPDAHFLPLKGYRVLYSNSARRLPWKIMSQLPRLKKTIREENSWLKNIVTEHQLDAVISDNRFGLYHKRIPSIFMTHQLTIKNSWGKWVESILRKQNYKYINRFKACWVPDEPGENNLAGELSHPQNKPRIPVFYLGPLTRFEKKSEEIIPKHLVILLSGPEPQRSITEEIILRDIGHYNGTATILRGLPASDSILPSTNMLRFYNHLAAEQLNTEISKAEFVISTGGYSSIMDLLSLQKKAILIPTPGQPEQEWLAGWLSKKQFALCISQKEFALPVALEKAAQFPYQFPFFSNEQFLRSVISDFIASITK